MQSGLSNDTLCQSGYGKIKIHSCLKSKIAEHRPKFYSPSTITENAFVVSSSNILFAKNISLHIECTNRIERCFLICILLFNFAKDLSTTWII